MFLNALFIYDKGIDLDQFKQRQIWIQKWIESKSNEVEYRVDLCELNNEDKEWLANEYLKGISLNKLNEYNYVIFYL